MGNDTYRRKLLKITSHTASLSTLFLWNYKKIFLRQATQRIFNFIILFKHVFFSISILHFLSEIEYLTDLLYCHWASSGCCWFSNSIHNLILKYRLALAKDIQLSSYCMLRRTLRNMVSLSDLTIYEFIVTPQKWGICQ